MQRVNSMIDTVFEFPIAVGDTMIYGASLPVVPRGGRHIAERECVNAVLREVFGEGAALEHDVHGAPYLPEHTVNLSVSHGAGMAVVAVNPNSRIGVDVECVRDSLLRTAHKFLSDEEYPVYSVSPLSLLRAWTSKEAVFKAAGRPHLTVADIVLPPALDAGAVKCRLGCHVEEMFHFTHLCSGDVMLTLAVLVK